VPADKRGKKSDPRFTQISVLVEKEGRTSSQSGG